MDMFIGRKYVEKFNIVSKLGFDGKSEVGITFM